MDASKDAIGAAILEFAKKKNTSEIIVASDICEDDTIPVFYLFRDVEAMPELEKVALQHCAGSILDVGAGAGIHTRYLKNQGANVKAIDVSLGAVEYMQSQGMDARCIDFRNLPEEKYDTLLLLMNGIGIAGTLSSLEDFLSYAKTRLTENGKIICDSTNVMYLYEDEDGSMWMDLNSEYYGNFKFQMKYNSIETDWFDWLYVDYTTLTEKAEKVGLAVKLLFEDDTHFLVEMTKK